MARRRDPSKTASSATILQQVTCTQSPITPSAPATLPTSNSGVRVALPASDAPSAPLPRPSLGRASHLGIFDGPLQPNETESSHALWDNNSPCQSPRRGRTRSPPTVLKQPVNATSSKTASSVWFDGQLDSPDPALPTSPSLAAVAFTLASEVVKTAFPPSTDSEGTRAPSTFISFY